jgi:hypothetical protein
MKNNQRYRISNLPTKALFTRLEQYQTEYIHLESKQLEESSIVLEQRMRQIKDAMFLMEELVVKRILESGDSLHEIARVLINLNSDQQIPPVRKRIKQNIYQKAFVHRYLEYRSMIDYQLLAQVVDLLDLDYLLKIVCDNKKPLCSLIEERLANCPLLDLEAAIENLAPETVWEGLIHQDNPLYELARQSLERRIFSEMLPETEQEVLAKIELDISEEEGKMYNGNKGKRKIK